MHGISLWEETGVPGRHPSSHRETERPSVWPGTDLRTSVRKQCLWLIHPVALILAPDSGTPHHFGVVNSALSGGAFCFLYTCCYISTSSIFTHSFPSEEVGDNGIQVWSEANVRRGRMAAASLQPLLFKGSDDEQGKKHSESPNQHVWVRWPRWNRW